MIQQPHLHQGQRLLQARGDGAVGGGGLGISRGMVVADDHRRGVVGQRPAHDFARVDLGAVDRALEQLLERQRAMAGIQEQRGEDLVSASAQALGEIAAGRVGDRSALRRVPARRPGGGGPVPAPRSACRPGPGPGRAVSPAGSASFSSSARSGPWAASNSREVCTASRPRKPEPRKIASSSASDSAPAPRASSFSRGRSSVGQSRMCIGPACLASCLPGIRQAADASGKLTACTAIGLPRRGGTTN